MSIPTQLPPIHLAMRPGIADSLALNSGQVLAVRVLGAAASGGTIVQFGQQQLTLQLPTPPAVGTVLNLRVEGRGSEARLVLVRSDSPIAPAGEGRPQSMHAGMPNSGNSAGTASGNSAQSGAEPMRAALGQMMQTALARQGNIGSLLETINALGPVAARLPEPVRRLVAQIRSGALPLDDGPLNGAALRWAAQRSGTFQEAALASSGRPEVVRADLKGQLLTLLRALGTWLGNGDALPPLRPLPPPIRGAPPRALKMPTMSGAAPDSVEDAGRRLLDQADHALSRLRLLQNASIPEEAGRPGMERAEWKFDIPVILDGQASVLPFQIQREGGGNDTAPAERGWKVRFAVDLRERGEVGAQIGLRAGHASVLLWATEDGTAAAMEARLPDLSNALAAAGLVPGTLICRAGAPDDPARPSGGLVDATS